MPAPYQSFKRHMHQLHSQLENQAANTWAAQADATLNDLKFAAPLPTPMEQMQEQLDNLTAEVEALKASMPAQSSILIVGPEVHKWMKRNA